MSNRHTAHSTTQTTASRNSSIRTSLGCMSSLRTRGRHGKDAHRPVGGCAPLRSSDPGDARPGRRGDPWSVTDAVRPRRELLVFRFGEGAAMRGRLIGALERLESGGAIRVLDLFLAWQDADGEVVVFSPGGHSAQMSTSALLSFRLDAAERRRTTERALRADADGLPPDVVRDITDTLQPGTAVAAVLLEHVWATALYDAVAATNGAPVDEARVDADTLADVAADLVRAAGRD